MVIMGNVNRKIIAIVLVILIILSLAACGPGDKPASNTSGGDELELDAAGEGSDITDNFTDPVFKAYVYALIGKKDGEPIYESDVESIIKIDVSCAMITSLDGIEYFAALTELNCSGNQLTELDVSGTTALKKLYCENNQLTDLDLSENIDLTYVSCAGNQLAGIDVSNNAHLETLICDKTLEGEIQGLPEGCKVDYENP